MTLCPSCFHETAGAEACPQCSYIAGIASAPDVLLPGTLLGGRFIVGSVLGRGTFGITYLGWHAELHTKVAIKEFFPRPWAVRARDSLSIVPHTGHEEPFRHGREGFIGEARTLARLDHPNVVRVKDYFVANGTGYLIMHYYEGRSLTEYKESHKDSRLTPQVAIPIFTRVLDGLQSVHESGFLHRDIKPANIYLTNSGSPILLDFGAARTVIGETSHSLSIILTEGYAPPEQYLRRGSQGPWTDIYACGATLYALISGKSPPPAIERREADDLQPLHLAVAGVSREVSDVVMQALSLAVRDRPVSALEFKEMLLRASSAPGTGTIAHTLGTRTNATGTPLRQDHLTSASHGEKGGVAQRKQVRRSTVALVGAVLVAALIAGLTTWRGETGLDPSQQGTGPAPDTALAPAESSGALQIAGVLGSAADAADVVADTVGQIVAIAASGTSQDKSAENGFSTQAASTGSLGPAQPPGQPGTRTGEAQALKPQIKESGATSRTPQGGQGRRGVPAPPTAGGTSAVRNAGTGEAGSRSSPTPQAPGAVTPLPPTATATNADAADMSPPAEPRAPQELSRVTAYIDRAFARTTLGHFVRAKLTYDSASLELSRLRGSAREPSRVHELDAAIVDSIKSVREQCRGARSLNASRQCP